VTAEPDATVESSDGAPLGVSAPPPRSLPRAFLPIAVTGALLALVPLWLGDSRLMMGLAVDALVFGAYAVAFNVIFGSTNQLFLCVGALAGVGGYTAAILSEEAGLPMALGLVAATMLATAVGGLLSWVAVRRSLGVIFTGIVTLAFSLSFANLVLGQRELTGGETGLVVAAGEGRWDEDGEKRIPLDVAVGDKVLYSKYGGTEVKYSGEEVLILSGRDVLAIVTR